jgi:hypothetical protein
MWQGSCDHLPTAQIGENQDVSDFMLRGPSATEVTTMSSVTSEKVVEELGARRYVSRELVREVRHGHDEDQ